MSEHRAVVLSSGGIDSTTVMAIARAQNREVYSLTFNYGQRHAAELEAAGRVAEFFGVRKHLVIGIDMRAIGGSALTAGIDVPKGRSDDEMAHQIPITYVPARNTIFLSYALAWAEVLEAPEIFIGVNAVDYSGYPDCRPEFIAAYEQMANLATRAARGGKGTGPHPDPPHLHDQGTDHQDGDRTGGRLQPHPQLLRPLRREKGLRPVRQLHPEAEGVPGGRRCRSDRVCLRGSIRFHTG